MAGTPSAVTPECRNGYVVIGFEGEIQAYKDWYGLYESEPDKTDWRKGLVNYVPGNDNSGEWGWARDGAHKTTTVTNGDSLRTVYWTHSNGEYDIINETTTTQLYCKL